MPADIARRHCPQVLPTVRSLKVKLSSLALLKNFLVLLNNGMSISTIKSAKAEIFLCYSTLRRLFFTADLQKQKFSSVTQRLLQYVHHHNLQKQKFSCVTQLIVEKYREGKSAKAEIFLCYSTLWGFLSDGLICKSRNFLVLLNTLDKDFITENLQKQKFSCVTQQKCPMLRGRICKSRNFLVLLNFSTIRIFLTNLQKQKFSCVTQHLLRHYAQISTE